MRFSNNIQIESDLPLVPEQNASLIKAFCTSLGEAFMSNNDVHYQIVPD